MSENTNHTNLDVSRPVSPAVIKRLPRYYRYLGDLLKNGVTRISSNELSSRMNVTASQFRQDLNNFMNISPKSARNPKRSVSLKAGFYSSCRYPVSS